MLIPETSSFAGSMDVADEPDDWETGVKQHGKT